MWHTSEAGRAPVSTIRRGRSLSGATVPPPDPHRWPRPNRALAFAAERLHVISNTSPTVRNLQNLSVTWIAAKGGVTAIVCGVALLLSGCSDSGESFLTQKGNISVNSSKPQEVFYPTPFASPPKLTLSPDTSLRSVALVTQRPDGFVFKVNASQWSNGKLIWSAVGQNLRETNAIRTDPSRE